MLTAIRLEMIISWWNFDQSTTKDSIIQKYSQCFSMKSQSLYLRGGRNIVSSYEGVSYYQVIDRFTSNGPVTICSISSPLWYKEPMRRSFASNSSSISCNLCIMCNTWKIFLHDYLSSRAYKVWGGTTSSPPPLPSIMFWHPLFQLLVLF